MKTIFSKTLPQAVVLAGFFCVALSFQCKDYKYLYIESDSGGKTIKKMKDGVEVALELSSNSLIDQKLAIINYSENKIIIRPGDISIEFPGASLKAAAVSDYNTFLALRSKQMQSLCSQSSFSYSCVDQMRGFYNRYKDRGFPFDTINPGENRVGYIAFNIPLLLNNSKWDDGSIVGRISKSPSAQVRLLFEVGNKEQVVTFPIRVSICELDSLSYSMARHLK